MPAKKEFNEKKFLGVTIGDIVKIVLAGLVSATIAYMAFMWNSAKPTITWEYVQSAIYTKGNKSVGVYNVLISNNGIKEAENVECVVKVVGSKIDGFEVYPEDTRFTKTIVKDTVKQQETIRLLFPLFGESENVKLDILLSDEQDMSKISYIPSPIISLRGKGVKVGYKEQVNSERNSVYNAYEYVFTHQLPVLVMFVLIPSLVFAHRFDRKKAVELKAEVADLRKSINAIARKLDDKKGKAKPLIDDASDR